MRATAALAAFDPDSPRWQGVAGPVVGQLVAENPIHLAQWLESLRPVKGRLLAPLGVAFRDKPKGSSERNLATVLLADYAADRTDTLADLLMDADDRQFSVLFPRLRTHGLRGLAPLLAELERQPQPPFDTPFLDDAWESIPAKPQAARERLARRQANAAVALLRLERPESVWPLLKHRPDPRVRSNLIHRLSQLGADPHRLWRRFEVEADVSARRALLLCLGEFSAKEWPVAERNKRLPALFKLYREHPDPGLHGAAAWLLGQWGQREKLKELDKALASRERERPKGEPGALATGARRWYINGQKQTMVLIAGPVVFPMGSPRTEAEREGGADGHTEQRHYRRIGRSFAIAAHEITVEQFRQFRKDFKYNKDYARTADCPINNVSWFEAAEYCNWLSKQEGIPDSQWCYLPNADNKYAEGMKVKSNYLELTGHRLPTEAEWEYACRAGTVTARYYGETDELLPNYAWYTNNSRDRWLLPVGSLKPNELGLFDMLGNNYEWCQEPLHDYPTGTRAKPAEHKGYSRDIEIIQDRLNRLLRGGAFTFLSQDVRSANRNRNRPSSNIFCCGLRVARTLP